VKVFATNATKTPATGTLRGQAAGVSLQKDVTLAPARRPRSRSAGDVPALALANPKLWWPASTAIRAARPRPGARCGRRDVRPGPGEVRHPRVHGRAHEERPRLQGERRDILVRGAGWTSEMMLRYSKERFEQEIAYVKDMGLNAIRLGGQARGRAFLRRRRREASSSARLVLLRPLGEVGPVDAEDLPVAVASLRDQILRLRGHRPSSPG